MNISRKLVALGFAFGVLGSTCAFARPTLHSENVHLSHRANVVEAHVPAAQKSSAIRYAGRPSDRTEDDWPSNMHQE